MSCRIFSNTHSWHLQCAKPLAILMQEQGVFNKNAGAGFLITIGEDNSIMEIIGCACCLVNAVAVVEKHVGSLESAHLSLRHNFNPLVCSCIVAIFAVADDVASAQAQRRSRKADCADYQRIRNAALQHGTVDALWKDNK
jgi:nucleoside recognition membrane protein YjiH